jgi:hypothetical protein
MLTFSHYKNEIVRLNDLPFFEEFGLYAQNPLIRNEIGYPISSFFGYKIIGFFRDDDDVAKSPKQADAAPGRFKYLDADTNGHITDGDRVHFGNPNPKFTLGLNIGFTYRNFDFSTFFYGCFGNDIFNSYRSLTDNYSSPWYSKSKIALYDSWTPQHQDATAPLQENDFNFSNAAVINSYALEDGSYLRNKTMIFGYSFPKKWLQKIKIERFRIYLQAVNLFTITNYSGLDPELSGMFDTATGARRFGFGIDAFGDYPNNQKQYLIGLNLGF